MEKRISQKVNNHQRKFKDDIREWLSKRNVDFETKETTNNLSAFLRYLYDYQHLELTKEDFKRRKRITNVIPISERCIAKRASGDQCTRRKKAGHCYCGTHIKGSPHGVVDNIESTGDSLVKVDIWVEEIKGIQYYLDKAGNVYDPKDIIESNPKPKILAKWSKSHDGTYHIPALNI